jgi:lipoprotein NlpD
VRRLRSIGVTGLCLLLMSGCADPAVRRASTYVVRPQDTLYSIAWRHDLDYRDLARWNNIGPDFRIAVGQVLSLGPQSRAPPSSAAAQGRNPIASGAPQVGAARPLALPPGARPATPERASAAPASLAWVWPTDRTAAPRAMRSGGILIAGQLGQSVRAAAAGRVVYTGSGLRGYGQLVIIKHGDALLSAYAYNRELLVREGEEVAGGQPIAAMGQGTQQSAALYFEIRVNGKPTDPLPYLLGKK